MKTADAVSSANPIPGTPPSVPQDPAAPVSPAANAWAWVKANRRMVAAFVASVLVGVACPILPVPARVPCELVGSVLRDWNVGGIPLP